MIDIDREPVEVDFLIAGGGIAENKMLWEAVPDMVERPSRHLFGKIPESIFASCGEGAI